MSLKAFHVAFITAAILLSIGFGVWGINQFTDGNNRSALVMAIASLLIGVVLVVYEIKFLQKLKHVRFL